MSISSSINDFVAQISKDGIASPNRYWVEFSFPQLSRSFLRDDLTSPSIFENVPANMDTGQIMTQFNGSGQLSIMCTIAQMPGRTINTNEHKHENYPIKIPFSQSYDEVTLGFTLSENLKERRFFELWQDVVLNVPTGTLNFYNEYTAPLRIYALDKTNRIKYGVELRECYPTNLSAVDYTYASTNDILSMSVSLSYKYWVNIDYDEDFFYRTEANEF